jgi:metal-responsive CopG/Arc/MetJ family transcriptional regulator
MPIKEPDDSRVISLRLPSDLIERLDRYLDWNLTHQRVKSTRNSAMREALSAWLDQQEQIAGLLELETLRQQFKATYTRIRHRQNGVPIHQLRQLLRWPRERFDAVLEGLRSDHQVDLEALKETDLDPQATQDSYQVHGQPYVRIRWRD